MGKKKLIVEVSGVGWDGGVIVRGCEGVKKIRGVGKDEVEFMLGVIVGEVGG